MQRWTPARRHDGLLQPADVAVVEEPADHGYRDLPPALKLVDAREVEPPIGPRHRRFYAGVKVRVGLDYDCASEATVKVSVIQPVQGHGPDVMPATPPGRAARTLVAGLAVINATGVYPAGRRARRGTGRLKLTSKYRPRTSTRESRWQPTTSPTSTAG